MVLCLGLCSLASVICIVNMSPHENFVNPPSVPYAPDVDSLLNGIELKDLMHVVLVYAVFVVLVVTYFCVVTADPEQYKYYPN